MSNSTNNASNPPINTDAILRRLSSGISTVQTWDADPSLLIAARSQIPLSLLISHGDHNTANNPPSSLPHHKYTRNDDGNYKGDDLFIKRLALWFQQDFMTWVNSPPCRFCNGKAENMKSLGVRGPETQEEKDGGAGRVEVYECPVCNTETTFPRYNSPRKLLETRRGRCGEYANLFGLLCRSVGFETRYILDLTDHVWTEVWSHNSDRWIMVDSCEGTIDEPLMYEKGWGKKLSHMFAYSNATMITGNVSSSSNPMIQIVDVTKRYTRNFDTVDFKSRRGDFCPNENMLQMLIAQLNASQRDRANRSGNSKEKLSTPRRMELERRDDNEQKFFESSQTMNEDTEGSLSYHGRTSGSLAWRASRHELGDDTSSSQVESQDKDEAKNLNNSFAVESFLPFSNNTASSHHVSVSACSIPKTIDKDQTTYIIPVHNAIIVSNVPCAVGQTGLSCVIVDQITGCILQSRVMKSWNEAGEFVDTIPDGRIVILALIDSMDDNASKDGDSAARLNLDGFKRLGGLPTHVLQQSNQCILHKFVYVGQTGFHPDWTSSIVSTKHSEDGSRSSVSVNLHLNNNSTTTEEVALKAEPNMIPNIVSTRVPESIMPLQTQLHASVSLEQKKQAALSMIHRENSPYIGFATKPGQPVYLLTKSAFPFHRMGGNGDGWVTHHLLPKEMVPKQVDPIPMEIPVNTTFFNNLLGPSLLSNDNTPIQTETALTNKRLIGLYFSAHWCPPCKKFTPMLAEFYSTSQEDDSTKNNLEIIFISSDRDTPSFTNYFNSMPWLALPHTDQFRKQTLSTKFGIRGIPALVILDSISGLVISQEQARNEVMYACRGGDVAVKSTIQNWLSQTPEESQVMIQSMELSLKLVMEDGMKEAMEGANQFLVREKKKDVPKPKTLMDPSTRIKQVFAKLVANGKDPTSAAAEAIQIIAKEQQQQQQQQQNTNSQYVTFTKGPLSDRPWTSIVSLDCVSLPKWRNDKNASAADYCVFHDAIGFSGSEPIIQNVRLLVSSSTGIISGIQCLYNTNEDDNVSPGIKHVFSSTQSNHDTTQSDDLWSDIELDEMGKWKRVEGIMGSMGVERLTLISSDATTTSSTGDADNLNSNYTRPIDEKELEGGNNGKNDIPLNRFFFSLEVPSDLILTGFHGVLTCAGIVSIGLVCRKDGNHHPDQTLNLEEKMQTNDTLAQHSSTSFPQNVFQCAQLVLEQNDNDKNSIRTIISTAKKYLDNIWKEPYNPKYRVFKLNNKISDRICQIPGGLDLIMSLGFRVCNWNGDYMVSVPLASDLDGMKKNMSDVMDAYSDE